MAGIVTRIQQSSDIQWIVQTMKQNMSSSLIQEKGCASLEKLARHDEIRNQVQIARYGGIETILSAMAHHSSQISLQQQALFALGTLAWDEGNRALISSHRGIEAIIALLKAHAGSNLIQKDGCRALSNLALAEELRTKIGLLGGVDTLLSALHANIGDSSIVAAVFLGLGHLIATGDDVRNRAKITFGRNVEAILRALKQHTSNVDVQDSGFKLLFTLASSGDDDMSKLVSLGCFDVVLSTMKAHRDSDLLQEFGCTLLANLLDIEGHEAVFDRLDGGNGIGVILSAMKSFRDIPAIQGYGCVALGNLARSETLASKIGRLGGVGIVLAAMKTHASVDYAQRYGCACLINLCMVPANKGEIDKLNGLACVIAAVKAHRSDEDVQQYARHVLLYWGIAIEDSKYLPGSIRMKLISSLDELK